MKRKNAHQKRLKSYIYLANKIMEKNYEFFMKTDLSHYIGKWIAICDEKIISSGDNPKEVFAEAKKLYPKRRPLLTKVPEKETVIF